MRSSFLSAVKSFFSFNRFHLKREKYEDDRKAAMIQERSSATCSKDRRSGELTKPQHYEKLLSILWAGFDISIMLEAYSNFDRELLTSIHNRALLYLTHPQVGKVLLMHDTPEQEDKATHEATESLDELVRVKIKDLEIRKRNECCVIYGVLCVKPFKFGRIYTLLEELDTGKAVTLSIVSSDPSSIHQGFARDKYPQGMKIAVKEPFLVQSDGGIVFIDVDNPLCIESVQNLSAPEANQRKVENWISAGDSACKAEDWKACVRNHTKGLLSVSTADIENPDIIRRMHLQRWMANLKLGRFVDALEDAYCICRYGDLSDGVGAVCKIQALLSVGKYKEAFRFFQSSYASLKERQDIFTEAYRQWSVTYLYCHKFKPDGGFVGPVEIRMTNNGSGRGLFATENVQTAQTLLLSEPLAVARKALQDPVHNGLFQNVKKALASYGDKTLQIFLSHGSCEQIPNMLDFFQERSQTPSKKLLRKIAGKDDEIRQIIERIALDDMSSEAKDDNRKESAILNPRTSRQYYGVWLLASFINHSCVPNAATTAENKIVAIHATKPIKKGEEISIPYFGVLIPFPSRQKYCKSFGFDCNCKRCELEKRFMDCESKGCKSKIIYESYSNACKSRIQDRPVQLEKLVNQVEKCLRQRKSIELDEQGEAWIRSSFMASYFARIVRISRRAVKTAPGTDEETFLAAARSTGETCPGEAQNFTICEALFTLYVNLANAGSSSSVQKMEFEKLKISAEDLMEKAYLSVFAQPI